MIEPWTEEDRVSAFATFKKIANNNRAWISSRRTGERNITYPMPHDIYEAHRLTMKSICSEIGIFDEDNRILLTLRPPLEESPAEPYPNVWHIPGTRHIADETNEEALHRLFEDEIGVELEAHFVNCKEYLINGHTNISLLYTAHSSPDAILTNKKRQWFDLNMLPELMLEEHRAIVDLLSRASLG